MAKKTEYKVIEGNSNSGTTHMSAIDVFHREVEQALADGWTLVGGICISMPNALGIKHYAQAVVKTS